MQSRWILPVHYRWIAYEADRMVRMSTLCGSDDASLSGLRAERTCPHAAVQAPPEGEGEGAGEETKISLSVRWTLAAEERRWSVSDSGKAPCSL